MIENERSDNAWKFVQKMGKEGMTQGVETRDRFHRSTGRFERGTRRDNMEDINIASLLGR